MASSSSIGSPSPGTGGGFSISRISAGRRGFCRTGGTGGTRGLLPSVISSILRENSSGDRFISSGGIVGFVRILSAQPPSPSRRGISCGRVPDGSAAGFVSSLSAQLYGTGCAGLAGGFGGGRTGLSVKLGRGYRITLPYPQNFRVPFSGSARC